MKFIKLTETLLLILVCAAALYAQKGDAKTQSPKPDAESVRAVKASAAYTEILLRRTLLEADLEDLLVTYTREYPKVKEIQFQLEILNQALDKLFALSPSESQKLTSALGKLILQKMELETELWNLKQKYSDEHPDVIKLKRKVLVFESAIKDALL